VTGGLVTAGGSRLDFADARDCMFVPPPPKFTVETYPPSKVTVFREPGAAATEPALWSREPQLLSLRSGARDPQLLSLRSGARDPQLLTLHSGARDPQLLSLHSRAESRSY
ncbi:unnamed protein product, partial [Rangifer tarandus platyrhynchus]